MRITCKQPNARDVFLSLGFSYTRDEQNRPRNTVCKVYKMESPDDKTGTLLGTGTAGCHSADHLRKFTGRKVSLAKALKESKIVRDVRTVIWKEYLSKVRV